MDVEIVRSERRSKSVSARVVGGRMVVQAPAAMGDAELHAAIAKLRQRIEKRQARRALDDGELQRRAYELNRQYFDGKLSWTSIVWTTGQEKSRWGSCTPALGTIRLSSRLAETPTWVRDYVLMHELAHLVEGNHGPRFWRLVNRYPKTERARGYLMALAGEDEENDM